MLQFYGESGQLKFGMMTGSYQKNKSGGVLRKNISNISDEINTTTDGTFKTTLPGTGSIIASLGRMRVFDYDYADGTYGGSCSFGKTQFSEGNCRSWGNPMSEIYLESLRYLAGKTPNPSFDVVSDDLFPPRPTWSDPLTTQNYCAPLNVLIFNSASSTNENDGQFGSASDLGVTGDTADATTGPISVGTLEGINGSSWFVGNDGAGSTPVNLCSAKTVANLASAFRDLPRRGWYGRYLPDVWAGLLLACKKIRNPGPLTVPASDSRSLKVTTFGIALATNTPKTTISVNGKPVTILPQGRLDVRRAARIPGSAADSWSTGRSYVRFRAMRIRRP